MNISRIYNDKIRGHRHYDRALHWTKLISVTGSSQLIIQALGMVTGFIVIQLLPVREFAYYTIATTILGTMTLLADGGISSGVMAFGGQAWSDRYRLGAVLATGLDLRRKFAFWSLLVTIPILYYLLNKQGAHWWEIAFIIAAIIPSFFAALSDSLLEIVPKLHQDITSLQKNQIVVGVLRFILIAGGVFFFPFTAVAMIANGIPRIYGNIKLKVIADKFADSESKPDPTIGKDIMSIVYRMMPEAIYYSLSGQIAIWFLSFLGNVNSIAQIGALGKISAVATLFTIVFSTLIMPRFARLGNERKLLIGRYIQVMMICLACLTIMILLVWLFSGQILMVLGNAYRGLDVQLTYLFIGTAIGLLAGFNYSMFTSRGWIMNPVYSISINLLSLGVCAYFIDISTLDGAIIYGVANSLIQLVVNTGFFIYSVVNKTK